MPGNANYKAKRRAARQKRRELIARLRTEYLLLRRQSDAEWDFYCNGHPNAVNLPRLQQAIRFFREREARPYWSDHAEP